MAGNQWRHLLAAQSRRESIRENSGRFATLSMSFETEGTGELLPSLPLEFPTPFLERPFVSHGFELLRRADLPYPPPQSWDHFADLAESDPTYSLRDAHADYSQQYTYHLPTAHAGVYRWVTNSRGFYLGAFIYYNVQADFLEGVVPSPSTPIARPIVRHDLVFMGDSYKSMSDEVNEAADDEEILPLTPPTLGIG